LSEVKSGLMTCEGCKTMYPVQNRIPVLLVFPTKFHASFARKHAQELGRFSGYRMPDKQPELGEKDVQESFTDEWNTLQDDEITFLYTDDDLFRLHREVWLQWETPPPDVKRILNLGVGFGKESEILTKIVPGSTVFAVDLNLALLNRQDARVLPNVQFVIASVFHLPFPEKSFDLVYSQGVIHHTYSTRKAYDALRKCVRAGGYLFVWLYGAEDAFVLPGFAGTIAKLRWLTESLIRPLIARLPRMARNAVIKTFAVLLHPLVRARVRLRSKWTFTNTTHLMFDYLGPRYAYKHAYNEVIEWFEDDGFDITVQSPSKYRRLFGKRLWGVGVMGHSRV